MASVLSEKSTTKSDPKAQTPEPKANDDDKYPQASLGYLDQIHRAERYYTIPKDLLFWLLWKESRFRPDIINGETVSSAGALGIAQIIPKYHPDVDPLDPNEAITYAAKYLRYLWGEFGSWEEALVAYNWGMGNLAREGINTAPKSSLKYAFDIMTKAGVTE